MQFGINKHLKNLLVLINTKLHQTKLLPIQEKQTKKTETVGEILRNKTNRKERKQWVRY